MSAVITVRGWIDCDDDQIGQVEQIIAAHQHVHFSKAWALPAAKESGSWINFAFFGAAAGPELLAWIEPQLEAIAALTALSPDEHVRGLFFVSTDAGERWEWRMQNGALTKLPAALAYRYLDA